VFNLLVYSATLRGGCSTVDCALCRQLNKRTLLLNCWSWRDRFRIRLKSHKRCRIADVI